MPTFTPAYGFYDVTAYGAVGNGTHDDSTAIYNAEVACEATGGVVFFPPGTYLIGSKKPTIPIAKSGIQWRGTGSGSSIILAPAGAVAPTLIQVGSSSAEVSDITFADLGFSGNGVNPTGGAVNPPVLAFGGSGYEPVSSCKVVDCNFTGNTGSTITFIGVTDVEVTRCLFEGVGYHYSSGSGYFGRSYLTPAIFIDGGSTNARVHHNEFSNCQYDGVFSLGLGGEISYNHFDSCYSAAIDVGLPNEPEPILGPGSDLAVVGNYIIATSQVTPTEDAYGIALIGVQNVQAVGNTVTQTYGHGIFMAAASNCAIIGNICYNNGKSNGIAQPDGCGITFDGDLFAESSYSPNQSIVIVGNICYDSEATPSQQYGLKIFNSASLSAAGFVVGGNTFWGNAISDIFVDSLFIPDSNVAITNTGADPNASWVDRQHRSFKTITGSAKASLLSDSLSVGPHSLVFTRGFRVVASGVADGSGEKAFYFGLNASGNLMTATMLAGGANVPWQIVAHVVNELAENSQKAMVQFWYGGSLVSVAPASLSINMRVSQPILLEGMGSVSGDSITCHFVSYERI